MAKGPELSPDQYVLLKILNARTEDNVQHVDEVALIALIKVIKATDEATRELLKCESNNIVYHTGQEK
ncbi:hypothetical protein [Paenibacillus thalictri]|uniref:Uncharacterized protein n=1 Tax=Paenibacillus thalictri TaxID=2527873 RepID=A0A4Q9DV04_9BACL|nr:hypothetical protein [Paenibacillus thalictri]TBL80857.1 hypothetical protein EYB31_06475 [Paenibacillus thalictri]